MSRGYIFSYVGKTIANATSIQATFLVLDKIFSSMPSKLAATKSNNSTSRGIIYLESTQEVLPYYC
jgi:hypothetical protein